MDIIEPGNPPDDIPYLDMEDFLNRELLRVNGISLSEEQLIAVLNERDAVLSAAAAHTLGSGAHLAALSHLTKKLRSEEDLLQVEAAYALGRMNEEKGLATLHECLKRPIEAYVSAPLAAGYLARLGDASGYDVVARSLASDILAIRMIACKQISCFVPFQGSQLPTGETVDVFSLVKSALRDEEVSVRWQVLVQLAWMDSAEARKLLETCLKESKYEDFRRFARRVLDGEHGLAAKGDDG